MTDINLKRNRAFRRSHKVRAGMLGTAARPRLSVFKSLSHISVQLIDDENQKTLASASDDKLKGTKTEKAVEVGKLIAKKAQDSNIKEVIFDRGANRYHGRVKALADAAREAGLVF